MSILLLLLQAPGHKLVLVDDLPHAHGPEQRARLSQLLTQLAATARNPVIVTLTEAPFLRRGALLGWQPLRQRSQIRLWGHGHFVAGGETCPKCS